MYYTTRAIILSSAPQGERARQFHLLTEARGLVVAQAQGVVSMRSKLGPCLTAYRLLAVTCTHRTIERIIGVEVKETYKTIWADARRQGYAAWALDIVRYCLKPGAPDPLLFTLTLEYLRDLNDNTFTSASLPLLRLAFAVKFISMLGYHGSRIDEPEVKGVMDRAILVGTLTASGDVLRPWGKQIHERVELVLQELSGRENSMPAHFLTHLSS